MRAFFLSATAAAALAAAPVGAHDLTECVSQSMTDAVGEWSLTYFVRNMHTGALTQGVQHRRTERPDDYTLIHNDDTGEESYVLADVFDPEGFTRFDVGEDGARTRVFRVDLVSCEGPDEAGYRSVVLDQRLVLHDAEYLRRWRLLSSENGIIVNQFLRPAGSEEPFEWASFYGLVAAQGFDDVAMQ